MFTDMVGYTALTQTDESRALEVLERHNRLLRPFFPKFHGKEVKAIGDSFLAEFESALDAINCAVEIQRFLHEYDISPKDEWKIRLRIGIHLGDVVHSRNDVFGDAVNIASRLYPIAEPEGICISDQVFGQIRNKISQPLLKLEPQNLKNVRFPVDVYRVVMPWEKESAKPTVELDSRRIAVLPFVSMSPDPNDEFFADGLTEELIDRLSQVTGFEVIARTSIMSYKKKDKKAEEIGRELRARSLVEGSVRKAGNRIRVTAQLVDAKTDGHLWSSSYDRNLEDTFSVQGDIAEKVAEALKVRLLPANRARMMKQSTGDAEAHILYLKGLALFRRRTREGIEKSIEYYERAVQRDPIYAIAYAAIADSFLQLGFSELRPSREVFPKAKVYAERALATDPDLPQAHLALGNVIRLFEWDYDHAEKEYKRAIELNPSLAEAHFRLGILLCQRTQFEEAIREVVRGLELDPMSANSYATAGMVHLYSRHYDDAISELDEARGLDPNTWGIHNLALALAQNGRIEEGLELMESDASRAGGAEGEMELAYVYTRAEKFEEARKILSGLLSRVGENPGLSAAVAGVYASLGEKDNAFEWLERAYKEHAGFLKAHLGVDFVFDPLRSDPRFQSLLERIGWAS
jgi:adenylate cyclase